MVWGPMPKKTPYEILSLDFRLHANLSYGPGHPRRTQIILNSKLNHETSYEIPPGRYGLGAPCRTIHYMKSLAWTLISIQSSYMVLDPLPGHKSYQSPSLNLKFHIGFPLAGMVWGAMPNKESKRNLSLNLEFHTKFSEGPGPLGCTRRIFNFSLKLEISYKILPGRYGLAYNILSGRYDLGDPCRTKNHMKF